MNNKKSFIKSDIKRLGNSEIEISVEVDKETLKDNWQAVLAKITKETEISGFRKGQAPQKMVIEKIGESAILEESAEKAVRTAYFEILDLENIETIGRPEITITKLALGNNLEFKIKTALTPEMKIGPYTEIAKKRMAEKISEPEVSEQEIEEVIKSAIKHKISKKGEKPKEEDLVLDDNLAKELGASDINDLKNRVRDGLKSEKVNKERSKRRMTMIEDVINDSSFEIPEVVIQSELQRMIGQFKEDVKNTGVDFKDYLSKTGSSEEQITLEWRPQAEKKAKVQMILNTIAKEQGIKPDESLVETEIKAVLNSYPDADRQNVEIFVKTALTNESVFSYLEKLGGVEEGGV